MAGMQLQFLGAARTVTGSCHLLEVNGKKILLDCGLQQGKRKESFHKNRRFAFDPRELHSLILSHSHIDHSGNIPRLVASGFKGPIVCTAATRDLCELMLRDSARIQEKDIEYVNRKRKKRGQSAFEPLYTLEDAEQALDQFEGVPYDHAVRVAPGVQATFQDAGHILGSASVHLDIEEGEQKRTLVFTGDIGRLERPILRDPVPIRRADILISESTYGDRLHEPEADVRAHLKRIIGETFQRGGKVLIPAFSVGRTQHLVYHLHHLFLANELPEVPLYVDSPLAANVTKVYRRHPECYDAKTIEFLTEKKDPFGFYRLEYTRNVAESKAINEREDPCVVISASGMCEAGRVLHHLKRIAPDPNSTILCVGFMAQHTLGRRILDRVPELRIYGDEVPLEAHVEFVPGLSGHADRDEMLSFFRHLESPPSRTFLVHGEEEPATAFAESLRKELHFKRVDVPHAEESFRL